MENVFRETMEGSDKDDVVQRTCVYCEKVYKQKKILYEHLRKVHKLETPASGTLKCPIRDCSVACKHYVFLREHLEKHHCIIIEKKEFRFQTKSDFLQWKEVEEKKSKASYCLSSTTSLADGSKKSYFSCHRSGNMVSKSSGTRAQKSQGSCKTGVNCPSTIEVVEGPTVTVTYYKTHIGHKMEFKHLSISQSEKDDIARKLSTGVPLERCLDDVRNTLTNTLSRIHLLTRRDLLNIGNANHLFKVERRHENDLVSVELFVQEMESMGTSSPVIFFKNQGKTDFTQGISKTAKNLDPQDFCLVLIKPVQKEMLQTFGQKKICIDSTHGTNSYDFQLTTIVVIDEFETGFPAAFCISNRIDVTMMQVFFEAVLHHVGTIATDSFMSDDAPAYYNAWKKVMGIVEKKLLCTWHVDRNWRQALCKVKVEDKKVNVYKYIRTLLEETDQQQFHFILRNVLNALRKDEDTKAFGEYFEKYYAERYQEWAYSYRLNIGLNTNMYLEAFHKVLKHVYMDGKVCKRVDTCISHLMKVVKDKTFERFTKLIKGSNSRKSAEIHARHKESLKLPTTDIIQLNPSEWQVKSQSCSKVSYTVCKQEECHSCQLSCSFCRACIHWYTCTCIDSCVRGSMCKHIHAVHCTSVQKIKNVDNEHDALEMITESESFRSFSNEASIAKELDNHDIQIKLDHASNLLKGQSLASDTKNQLHKHLDSIIGLLSSSSRKMCVQQGSREPANKKLKLQPRFQSTKKKNYKRNAVLAKPTINYKLSIKEAAVNNCDAVNVHDSNDHCYTKL